MCWTISTDVLSPCTGEQEIKALKVKCNNYRNGCAWVGELRSLDDHLTTLCGYVLLCCTNECMENKKEVRILRRDLDHHLKNKCPNRQYQCPYCKVTGRYCDITTIHSDTCPKVKVLCPNTDCKALVPRCKLADHQSKCQYEAVSCKYAEIGCQKRPSYRSLQRHENDDMAHLHLVIETVHEQQQKMKTMKTEALLKHNTTQKQLKALKVEQNLLKEKQRVLAEEQKTMADSVTVPQTGPCVFKMPEFSRHKSSKNEWYSRPFYTSPGGYKMCVRVDANGNAASGMNSHVSVFSYFMRGKNDDNLPWPFIGDVKFTLLNQLADKNHHTNTLTYCQDMNSDSNKRVEGESDIGTGYGLYRFIPHDQLNHDAEQNRQYLLDDALFFRIELRAAKPAKPWLTCTI